MEDEEALQAAENKFRYNLSPDYQHVTSKFKDTKTTVAKLRKNAEEKRESYREAKERDDSRLPAWGPSD